MTVGREATAGNSNHSTSLDAAVVTGNTREFRRVQRLRVEDWRG